MRLNSVIIKFLIKSLGCTFFIWMNRLILQHFFSMKDRQLIILLLALLVLGGCGEYNRVLKSTDVNYKYEKAKSYYLAGDYNKSVVLFEEISPVLRGTDRSEEVLYLMANSYFGQGDYMMAGHYFNTLARTFPNGPYTEESYYQSAYCLYLDSPKASLDQSTTRKAIDAFELFINLYPTSENSPKAEGFIQELQDKLVEKEFLNVKLYFDLGNYMGNNYQSAVIAAQNCLKEYPDTKYREELSFLILKSKYIQAVNSVETKMAERLRDAIDEYYSFVNDFPESEFKKEARRMLEDSQKTLKRFN